MSQFLSQFFVRIFVTIWSLVLKFKFRFPPLASRAVAAMEPAVVAACVAHASPHALFEVCLTVRATGTVFEQALVDATACANVTTGHILRTVDARHGGYQSVGGPVVLREQQTSYRTAFDAMMGEALEDCDDDTLVVIAAELQENEIACQAVDDEAQNRGLCQAVVAEAESRGLV